MLEYLAELDKILFLVINVYLANPVTDLIMPVITSDNVLRVIYVLILIGMAWFGDRRVRWLILFSVIAMAASDQLSSNFLKHLIERDRPCHVFTNINLLVACGGGFSMPSSHAANVFAQAVLLSRHVKLLAWPMYILAIAVSLSRVFVGVHYPADIVVGALVGWLVARIVSFVFARVDRLVLSRPVKKRPGADDAAAPPDSEKPPDDDTPVDNA